MAFIKRDFRKAKKTKGGFEPLEISYNHRFQIFFGQIENPQTLQKISAHWNNKGEYFDRNRSEFDLIF